MMTLAVLKALWRFRAAALTLALVLGAWAWVASERRAAYARGQQDQTVALLVRSVSRRIAVQDSLGAIARHDREVAGVWHARTLTARATLDSALAAARRTATTGGPAPTITVPAADVQTVVTSEAKCTLALRSCAEETAALRLTIADLRALPVLTPRTPQHPKIAALAGFLVGAAVMVGVGSLTR